MASPTRMVFFLPVFHGFLFLLQPFLDLPGIHILYFVLFLLTYYIFHRCRKDSLSPKTIRTIVILNYGIYVLHLIVLQAYHYYSFFLTENDVVSITEVILETERGNFFTAHHFGTPDVGNYLAHHFSPILAIFVPFFLVFPFKMTYCATLVFFSALGLFLWERVLSHLKLPLGSYFVLSQILLYNSFLYRLFTSYHFELLSFCFVCLILYGMVAKKKIFEGLGVLLFLLIKEDMPLYLFLFSSILFFQNKRKKSMIYASISILYFVFIQILQSHLDSSARVQWISAWEPWGTSAPEILGNLLTSPIEIGKIFWEKRTILQDLFGSFGYLPLLFFQGFGSVLPILSLHLLSSREWYNSFYHYYSYPILLSFLYAMVGLAKPVREDGILKYPFLVFLLLGSIFYTLKGHREFPEKWGSIDWERVRELNEIQKQIPKNATVQVGFDMGMHLRKDIRVYRLQKDFHGEYILVDRRGMSPYYPIENINEDIEKVLKEEKILLYASMGSVKLYKRKEER